MTRDTEFYLRLNIKEFESTKKRANQDAIDDDVNNEDAKNDLLYNAKIQTDCVALDESDKDCLNVYGTLFAQGKNLGWVDLKIPINQELGIEVIERYMKKLGKLKTILEATKD